MYELLLRHRDGIDQAPHERRGCGKRLLEASSGETHELTAAITSNFEWEP